ncbi:MAG: cell division protein ZapE [Verrucomicrobia bacterium]|nr:cell division protein ZapE [Verrucomicrobiota bacterium]
MAFFCSKSALVTESDVEQKLIYPLLSSPQGLGFNAEEIKTKSYLPPTDLDKGAGRKVGYYPDYAVLLSSLPALIVEAKAPGENVEQGFREAQLYAHEINKRFSTDINPSRWVIAANGENVLYGKWDCGSPIAIPFDALIPGSSAFEDFRAFCQRSVLVPVISQVRAMLVSPKRWKALKIIGGPTKQGLELPPNRFARDLVPLLRMYFDPDASRTRVELVEKAYCPSEQTTHYTSVLEALLQDNLSRKKFPAFEEVSTTKKNAPQINEAFLKALSDKPTTDPLLLITGGVGAGKSMFIDRFFYYLMDAQVRQKTMWAFVDFNDAPADLANLELWIANQVLEDFPIRNAIEGFKHHAKLMGYFAPDVAERKRGPYHNLPDAARESRLADDLTKWVDDSQKLVKGVLRYFGGDCGKRIIVVFDNSDKRDRDQQLRIFQEVQHFRATHHCFCILSMRDETYDRYKNEPPLDAYLTPFAFRISPPRFLDVAKRRLELIIEDLTANAPKRLEYSLPNGVRISYPATDLGAYLIGVYRSLFHPSKRIRLVLEALAGRDVRRALQMFAEILMSGHLTDDRIFSARYGQDQVHLPEWLVIRILMRTKYQYFSEGHGYVTNLLDVDETSTTTTNFLLCEALDRLAQSRKQQGELGIEGYRHVEKLVDELSLLGYLAEDSLWALERLLNRRLIIADHQRQKGISRNDYVKISASGFFHLRVLLGRSEYLAGIAADTWLREKPFVEKIAVESDLGYHTYERNAAARRARTVAFQEALKIERGIHNAQSLTTSEKMTGANYVQESIQKTLDWKPPASGHTSNVLNELFAED